MEKSWYNIAVGSFIYFRQDRTLQARVGSLQIYGFVTIVVETSDDVIRMKLEQPVTCK